MGLFVALEGIDGAGKTSAAGLAAQILRRRGWPAVAVGREEVSASSGYASGHMAALRELIWGEPPDAPYLELGDEHWVHLQAAWYRAFAQCVVTPALAEGTTVLTDTWGYKFLAKLALRPPGKVSFDSAWSVFTAIEQPDFIVYLRADPAVAATRKGAFSSSETGNREGNPDFSAQAFASYQQQLARMLDSFASRSRWISLDTSPLDREQAGKAVADIAEQQLDRLAKSGCLGGEGG